MEAPEFAGAVKRRPVTAFDIDRCAVGDAESLGDGRENAAVDVVPLIPEQDGPYVELLSYRSPAGRLAQWTANDIAATRIVWKAGEEGLIADPDGHLRQLGH
jgi:hypothetical protein